MKKLFFSFLLIAISSAVFAQKKDKDDNEKSGGFKKENIFIGTSLGLGIGGWENSFSIGANPQIGYSLAQWIDAGIVTNINYFSFRYTDGAFNYKQNSTNYGAGGFIKLYPINMFHIQAQYEYNWINTKVTQQGTNISQTFKQEAPSLLLGVGYGQRIVGQSSFFTTLLLDVSRNINSPYVDNFGTAVPFFRTGFIVYLKPKKQR
jgi:hypothetical protein